MTAKATFIKEPRALQSAIVEVPKEMRDDRPASGQCVLSRVLYRYLSMSGGSLPRMSAAEGGDRLVSM